MREDYLRPSLVSEAYFYLKVRYTAKIGPKNTQNALLIAVTAKD
jgi:hypothetical protein